MEFILFKPLFSTDVGAETSQLYPLFGSVLIFVNFIGLCQLCFQLHAFFSLSLQPLLDLLLFFGPFVSFPLQLVEVEWIHHIEGRLFVLLFLLLGLLLLFVLGCVLCSCGFGHILRSGMGICLLGILGEM